MIIAGWGRREDECWMTDDDRGMGEEGGGRINVG
jgi:hypothetical protein